MLALLLVVTLYVRGVVGATDILIDADIANNFGALGLQDNPHAARLRSPGGIRGFRRYHAFHSSARGIPSATYRSEEQELNEAVLTCVILSLFCGLVAIAIPEIGGRVDNLLEKCGCGQIPLLAPIEIRKGNAMRNLSGGGEHAVFEKSAARAGAGARKGTKSFGASEQEQKKTKHQRNKSAGKVANKKVEPSTDSSRKKCVLQRA
eukprot:g6973.t1